MTEKVVHIRIAAFRRKDTELWFTQLERQFAVHKITDDDMKFTLLESYLDADSTNEVKDILTTPPAADKYGSLKAKLISRLCTTEEQKIAQLLEGEALGERRPSNFLRHLRGLAGANAPDAFIRAIWMKQMPDEVRPILAILDDASLDKLAAAADRIVGTTTSGPSICSATTAPPSYEKFKYLDAKIDAISQQLAKVLGEDRKDRRKQPRGSRAYGARGRSGSRGRSQNRAQKFDTCWYHFKFGNEARKCEAPCKYSGSAKN